MHLPALKTVISHSRSLPHHHFSEILFYFLIMILYKLKLRRLPKFRSIQFLTVIILIIFYYLISVIIFPSHSTKTESLPFFSIPKIFSDNSTNLKCSVTIAIILCEDDRYLSIRPKNSSAPLPKRVVAKDFSRQINQTLVLLKSIAILSEYENSSCVEALLLSDKSAHYNIIQEQLKTKWAERFRKRIKVTDIPVRYPPGSSWMKNLFRPCATLRLFLAELLGHKWDSVLYLDTDIIFFQSVQALWSQFERFDEDGDGKTLKMAAMAPCLVHYGTPANSIPYYGTSGLNAGIMLMNLTRMRTSQWTNKIRMVTEMFHDKIKLADQDILNIYFHFFPEELHVLSCDWNFRPFQCRPESYCEDSELSQGISALHGNALSFTPQGPEPMFHTVFQTFHRAKLDDKFDLKKFLSQLQSNLIKVEEKARLFTSQCKQFGGLDVLILNRLASLVER